jgi:hypothetical protein
VHSSLNFDVVLCDQFGNSIADGSGFVLAELVSASGVKRIGHTHEVGIGLYRVVILPAEGGSGVLNVSIAGQCAAGFPREISVTAGAARLHAFVSLSVCDRCDAWLLAGATCAKRSELIDPGVHIAATAGEAVKLTLLARDASGCRQSAGGDVCTALLLSSDRSVVQVGDTKDLADGSYAISFLPTQVGLYLLQVLLNGELLADRVNFMHTFAVPITARPRCACAATGCVFLCHARSSSSTRRYQQVQPSNVMLLAHMMMAGRIQC